MKFIPIGLSAVMLALLEKKVMTEVENMFVV